MKTSLKKLAAGVLAAVMTVTCFGGAAPVEVNAAASKAIKVPVEFSGKNWEQDEKLWLHSATSFGFSGGDYTYDKDAERSISYTVYVPKQILGNKTETALNIQVHPNLSKTDVPEDTDGYVGEMNQEHDITLVWSEGKLTPVYGDAEGQEHVVSECKVETWGDYYRVTVEKLKLNTPTKWDESTEKDVPVEITENMACNSWFNGSVMGESTKVSSFILVDDVTLYQGDTAVVTQDFQASAEEIDKEQAVNEAQEPWTPEKASIVSYTKNLLKLAKSSASIKKGKKVTIKATASPDAKITYKSSNKKIATVTSKGVVTGVKKGTTTIKVTANGVTKTFKVTVK